MGSPGQRGRPHNPLPASGSAHWDPGVPVSQHGHPGGGRTPLPPGLGWAGAHVCSPLTGTVCAHACAPTCALGGGEGWDMGSRSLCPTGRAQDGLCALQREGVRQRAGGGGGGPPPPAHRLPVRPRPHASGHRLHPHPRLQQLPGRGGALGSVLRGAGGLHLQHPANEERGHHRSAGGGLGRRRGGVRLHPCSTGVWGGPPGSHRGPLFVPQVGG